MNRIHVQINQDGYSWVVKIEGGKGFSKSFWSDQRAKATAWAMGRLIALGGGEVIVHNRDGGVKEVWRVGKVGGKEGK